MVGVPRSTGCSTCVQRHLKCDEARPRCLRCVKSGRSCPGYVKRFVFKQSSLAIGNTKKRDDVSSFGSSGSSGSSSPSSDEVQVGRYAQWDSNPNSMFSTDLALLTFQQPISDLPAPFLELSQLLSTLIAAFNPVQTIVAQQPLPIRGWLSLVHDRIGTNASLDLAMRSLACLYGGQRHGDPRIVNTARTFYVQALRSLRDDLVSPRSSQSDIQSTTMLLTFYELTSNRTEDAWIKHSGGASQIMKLRGPEAYTSGYDYAMYLVCRGYIIIEAYMAEKPCFLEEPGWEALTQISPFPLQERLFACSAKVPRILRDAQRANHGYHDISDVADRADEMRTTVIRCFADWWIDLSCGPSGPVERPSGDAMFPVGYWFPNLLLPGLMCSHYTTLIILNHLLMDAGSHESKALTEECRASVVEICKCVFQAETRMISAIYMPFWLRVAVDICLPEHHAWITSKLVKFRSATSVGTQ